MNSEMTNVNGFTYHHDCLVFRDTEDGKLSVDVWKHADLSAGSVQIARTEIYLPVEVLRGLALTILAELED